MRREGERGKHGTTAAFSNLSTFQGPARLSGACASASSRLGRRGRSLRVLSAGTPSRGAIATRHVRDGKIPSCSAPTSKPFVSSEEFGGTPIEAGQNGGGRPRRSSSSTEVHCRYRPRFLTPDPSTTPQDPLIPHLPSASQWPQSCLERRPLRRSSRLLPTT